LIAEAKRGSAVEYVPPVEEFRVDKYELEPGSCVEIDPIPGPR